jgi:hypothetical protein
MCQSKIQVLVTALEVLLLLKVCKVSHFKLGVNCVPTSNIWMYHTTEKKMEI